MTLVGIFVGGASSRMGRPKGTLPHPRGGTLLEHLVGVCEEASLPCVLIGEARPYDGLLTHVPRLTDQFAGAGPMGGLAALVAGSDDWVISVACDMPYVDASTLRALSADPRSATLAARNAAGFFEPMLARWACAPTATAIAAMHAVDDHGLQRLLRVLGAETFVPESANATLDWDTPEDIGRLP